MKKLFVVVMFLALSFTLAACGKDTYIDGTFSGTGDKREVGWEVADVRFENDKIVEITLHRINAAGEEVDYADWSGDNNRPNLNQYRLDMANSMLASNDPTEVDTITGATQSSEGWIQAVARAIEKAKN